MIIGVPKEIKAHEYRIGINPAGVRQLIARGHDVMIENEGGLGAGFSNRVFEQAGAKIVAGAGEVWERAHMIMKVKEPLPSEFRYFRDGLTLYAYLHLAALPELAKALLDTGVNAVAYETITDEAGELPLLRPMSEIAGRMASQVGASSLEREKGGKGILLGGVPGSRRGNVVIIGGGVVGTAAARVAIGMGARVTVLDVDAERMSYLEDIFGTNIETLHSNPENIEREVQRADLLVGAVLIPGSAAPKLVSEAHLEQMENGSVVVDVAVDQGGCISTCRPTTHDDPTFVIEGVVHYCVANMPGAVPRSSTDALANATITHAISIANAGLVAAAEADRHIANGINTFEGKCVCEPVALAHGLEHTSLALHHGQPFAS